MEKERLKEYGFRYKVSLDEWAKNTFNGELIIYQRAFGGKWQLSYVDLDDYLYILDVGSFDDIINSSRLKEYERDFKINEILN